jgi:hypothetical protein
MAKFFQKYGNFKGQFATVYNRKRIFLFLQFNFRFFIFIWGLPLPLSIASSQPVSTKY